MFPRFTLLAVLLAGTVSAFDVRGHVVWNDRLSRETGLAANTPVQIDGGSKKALVRMDGSFVLHNVDVGEHILEVPSISHIFEPLYITLTNTSIHIQPYNPSHLPLPSSTPSLPYPIELHPLAKIEYYEYPRGIDIFGMLRSPMVLMILGTAVMAFGAPYLMSMMEIDPEDQAELDRVRKATSEFSEMATSGDWAGSVAALMSGTSAAKGAGSSAEDSKAAGKSSAVKGSNNAKRRK